MKKPKIATIVRKLMVNKQILNGSELARETGLPQPTMNRILNGDTEYPRKSAVETLSKYFSVTTNQLLGREPLKIDNNSCSLPRPISKVLLIAWEDIPTWPESKTNYQRNPGTCTIPTYAKLSDQAFAIKLIGSSMEPRFPENTILIMEPARIPKDRAFVVAYLSDSQVVFKQLLIDGKDMYLKSINSDLSHSIILMNKNDVIKGVLAQALINYGE
ncbi:MAG: S24 family peptidase [Gammaproteobacteria bacterium]